MHMQHTLKESVSSAGKFVYANPPQANVGTVAITAGSIEAGRLQLDASATHALTGFRHVLPDGVFTLRNGERTAHTSGRAVRKFH
jgi:hypothetical protein